MLTHSRINYASLIYVLLFFFKDSELISAFYKFKKIAIQILSVLEYSITTLVYESKSICDIISKNIHIIWSLLFMDNVIQRYEGGHYLITIKDNIQFNLFFNNGKICISTMLIYMKL